MCFTVQAINKEPKIAECNILVFKGGRIEDKIFTPHYQSHFQYGIDVIQKDVKLRIVNVDEIEEGYHSYMSQYSATQTFAYASIAIFYIPEGSTYYINNKDCEIVSSKIAFLGKYSPKLIKELLTKGYKLNSQLKSK